jgi:DNA-binding GntR family transcriptional regulator
VPNFYKTVKTALVELIRDEIIRGKLPPGTHLRLEELATQFNVSTMPIREALQALETEGIINVLPHKGAFVVQLSAEELVDIYEMRSTLESMATKIAVRKLNASNLQQMLEYLEKIDQINDIAQLTKLNADFHSTLYAVSQRSHLCEMITRLRYRTHHYMYAFISLLNSENQDKSQKEHYLIYEACRSGRAEDASNLVYNHVLNVGMAIAEYVRSQGKEGFIE